MIRASNLIRRVGIPTACATLSLAFYLLTGAQTQAKATTQCGASTSKAATKPNESGAECPMVSQVASNSTSKDGAEAAGQSRSLEDMELLFSVKLQDKVAEAVVPANGREGEYLGSVGGEVVGKRLSGTMRTSMFSGNCPVPGMRKGAEAPKGLHLCTLNPGGIIETQDGARIHFDGKGYGMFSPEKYRVSMTMAFATDDPRYQWLTPMLGAMEGEFDVKTGTAIWNVYLPRS
jgi:hypothetical protein